MFIVKELHGDIVFTVCSTNSEADPEARWGHRGGIGFRADCSRCGEFQVGASDEIGELLRGHIRWYHSGAAEDVDARDLVRPLS
jgi:hypothetical protein